MPIMPAKIIKNSIAILLLQSSLANVALATESNIWSFVGRVEPDHWSKLDKKFEACNDGGPKETIVITDANLPKDPKPLTFDYNAYPASSSKAAPSKHITIGEEEYKLVEFHIRLPAEHSINGNVSKAAIHFVHENTNQDAINKIAIVGVMLKTGNSNEVIRNLIATYNKSDAEKFAVEDGNLMSLVPSNTEYYFDTASLTTPPCTKEGVSWYIMKTPIEISKEEFASLSSTIEK